MHYLYVLRLIMISQWLITLPVIPIVRSQRVMDTHFDITMSNGIGLCTYHGITMCNDIAINFFYYVVLHL